MNRILLSGLGVGKELGVCGANNMNYAELLVNPEIILWADKICIPEHASFFDSPLGRQEELVIGVLEEENLIERFDKKVVGDCFDKEVFLKQMETEYEDFLKNNPHITRLDNDIEAVDRNNMYCIPRIASINATLLLANEINANCLFDSSDAEYLRYKSEFISKHGEVQNTNSVFREVLSVSVPNQTLLHEYGVYKNCISCKNEGKCKDTYLRDVEKSLSQYLEYRNYDEIAQLRQLIEEIKEQRNALLEDNTAEDIIQEIRRKQRKISKRINGVFPKIERFANLTAFVSVPITLLSALNGNTGLALASGITAGISTMTDKLLKNYESKNNWVNFVDRNNNRCK